MKKRIDKNLLIEHLLSMLQRQIDSYRTEISSIRSAIAEESKSSAGDKFETSRAMMQQELDKISRSLSLTEMNRVKLSAIDLEGPTDSIGLGSLVNTSAGNFLLAVAMGKVLFNEDAYFVISLSSPMGQALEGKASGDKVEVNGRGVEILEIY